VDINKHNLLYDASILTYFFEKSHYMRSGIFYTAYNVLKGFEKQQAFNITLLINSDCYKFVKKMKKDPFFSKFSFYIIYDKRKLIQYINKLQTTANILKKIYYILKVFEHCLYALYFYLNKKKYNIDNVLKKTNVFFSPVSSIYSDIMKYNNIKKYSILYDTMPLLYPEYYPNDFYTNDHITENAQINNLNKENYYFCISERTKSDYLKYYCNILDEKKMIITYIAAAQNFFPDYDKMKINAVLNKYNVKYKNNDKYIFSLCTLEPRKNLIFTVKCFIKFIMKHNIDNLYFYLGGAHWKSFIYLLKEQINSLNEYQDKIVRLGYVDDDDVNILYSNSLFFTYISQYEGFGMPPLEAMQAGTPVITSNNSSLPEVVGDAAIMIDYNSEEQCIKAFEDLYFNEDLRKYYIHKGLERAKLFSWEKTVDKMTEVIIKNAT